MDLEEKREARRKDQGSTATEPTHITPLEPLTHDAYGGGMYGTDDNDPGAAGEAGQQQRENKPPASDTQSADGPVEQRGPPRHVPPPSTGDRDVDITGQSYIQ
ncbi:hypothetical protein MLD38_024843 [Melastoma candidum]|uniref:Uncharacterized protein n=1 Tax=Melastoma candidum TaxID=119954 RepID=A0ACB9NYP3_9MYRT|nr:hypothetical protein MLD38_024843 [Melastoma candidum]